MNRIVLIADDFTGAADTGVHFACGGMRTALVFGNEGIARAFDSCEALALSTETRFMPPREAAETVRDFTARCRLARGKFFYKKVDSALRGNPGLETAAVLTELDIPAALVCPAMPATGRSVEDGMLLVNGTPLRETNLGRDVFTPVHTSSVAERFAGESGLLPGNIPARDLERGRDHLIRAIGSLLDAGRTALVADAVTEDHLAALADAVLHAHEPEAALPRLLPVGSAGLGKMLARALSGDVTRETIRPRGRLLAVVGSLSASAMEQTAYAVGSSRYSLLPFSVESALADPDRESRALVRAAAAVNGHILLQGKSMETKGKMTTEFASRVATAYGRLAAALCREIPFTAVFATGGSIAMSVAGHLGLDSIILEEELLPGVPLASCASGDSGICWFISKAGSFGGKEALAAIADALNR